MSHKLVSLVILGLFLTDYSVATGSAQTRKNTSAKPVAPPPVQEPAVPAIKLTQPSKVGDTPQQGLTQPVSGPIQVGEKLSYNVSWSDFVSAARLEVELVSQGAFFGQEGYQLKTTLSTLGQVRTLFAEVDNQYVSYIDSRTLLPYRADYNVRQGRRNDDNSICFDRQGNQAIYSDSSSLPVPVDAIDLPSIIFWLRQQDLVAEPKGRKIAALLGRQIVDIDVVVKGKERVATQTGSYEAIRVDLTARHPDKGEFKVRVWFTDDKQKLPVLMVSRPSFGEVRAELAQVTRRPSGVNLTAAASGRTEIATTNPMGVVMEAASAAPSEYEKKLPFAVGERLNYDIGWLGLGSIGKLNLVVQQRGTLDGKTVFELMGDISTVGATRSIINLNDTFKSYAAVDSLVPLRTDTTLLEGKRRRRVIATYKDNSVKLDNGTSIVVPPKALDLVSLFYSVRGSQLLPGSSAGYSFIDSNHRLQTIEVKAVRNETINSSMGPQNTIQLDILNKETHVMLAQAWVTNDARKLPVYVVAKVAFGEIRFEIKSASSTR